MTPDERLREAVGDYLLARQRAKMDPDAASIEAWDTAHERLVRVFIHEEDPRPCINAAVKVGRKPWWRFW